MADRQVVTAALVPGLTVCADCRDADAAVTVDPGERWARHVCLDCADADVERACLPPAFAGLVKTAREEWRYRSLPRPQTDWESADHSKLNALRAQWARFSATVRELDRCWAMLADGSRCVRVAADAGVCETHAVMGCRLPGLGWRGGEPQGRMIVRLAKGRSAA